MKKNLCALLCFSLIFSSSYLIADDCLQAAMDEMNAIHKSGYCHDDPIFECVSSSMIAWGVGLFVGIALLTGFVHQSKPSKTTTSTASPTTPVTPIQ